MTTKKIGELVQLNIPQLLRFCAEHDPEELVRLSEKDYSRERFKLSYAFLVTPAEANLIKQRSGRGHYYAQVHDVLDHRVRVTHEWFARSRSHFLAYLADLGLEPIGATADEVELALDEAAAEPTGTGPKASSVGGARFKKTPIGVAQNAVVRHVLGSLDHQPFSQKDWLSVKQAFGHGCAYCGERRTLVMDHAVPISLEALGEHHLGNLVPACHACNTEKGKQAYSDYLRTLARRLPDAEDRLTVIQAHMSRHDYSPLTQRLDAAAADEVRAILLQLRKAVDAAATNARQAITELLA